MFRVEAGRGGAAAGTRMFRGGRPKKAFQDSAPRRRVQEGPRRRVRVLFPVLDVARDDRFVRLGVERLKLVRLDLRGDGGGSRAQRERDERRADEELVGELGLRGGDQRFLPVL